MAEIKIINGVNTLDANLVGKTVADIRLMLSQALNIDPEAVPQMNGEQVDESFVLSEGDELEFVKASGKKG